jgi:hypothetical protein
LLSCCAGTETARGEILNGLVKHSIILAQPPKPDAKLHFTPIAEILESLSMLISFYTEVSAWKKPVRCFLGVHISDSMAMHIKD